MSPDSVRSLADLRREAQRLRFRVYSQPDPATDPQRLQELADAEAALAEREQQTVTPTAPPPCQPPEAPVRSVRFLGPETTGLEVTTRVHLNPIPTSIYHLLDPQTDPLVTVVVKNVGNVIWLCPSL
jgi:hypothetical protein